MARIDAFLRVVVEQQASDLHLGSGSVPAIRKDGGLLHLPFRILSEDETRRLLYEIVSPEQRDQFEQEQALDFLYEVDGLARFRGNLFEHALGIGSVFRIIPPQIPTLASLRLPPIIRAFTQKESGLVLICGPTGSGKTTTLAAMVNEINATSCRHIVTIEDPIEFIHPPLRSVVSQRQTGVHTKSFAAASRAALREEPNVLVVGEIRDWEGMDLALTAAEAGVLVLGTLHASAAAKAVHRIVDTLPSDQMAQALQVLATNLIGIASQQLLPSAAGEGRVPVVEVLVNTPAAAQLIRDNKVHQIESYMEAGDHEGEGMFGLDQMLHQAVMSGAISLTEALSVAHRPDWLKTQVLDAD